MTERRPLHPVLQAALDSLSHSDRRVLLKLAFEHDDTEDQDSWLTRLLDGLAVQAAADHAMERGKADAVLYALEADHRAHVEAVDLAVNGPPPLVRGVPATFDPDTGEFKLESG